QVAYGISRDQYSFRRRGIQRNLCFFFSSSRRHTRLQGDWSSDVCSSDLFYFLGGLTNYKYNDGGEQDTGIPFQRTGLRVQFILTSSSTYKLIVTACGGSATSFVGSYSGSKIGRASCRESGWGGVGEVEGG